MQLVGLNLIWISEYKVSLTTFATHLIDFPDLPPRWWWDVFSGFSPRKSHSHGGKYRKWSPRTSASSASWSWNGAAVPWYQVPDWWSATLRCLLLCFVRDDVVNISQTPKMFCYCSYMGMNHSFKRFYCQKRAEATRWWKKVKKFSLF